MKQNKITFSNINSLEEKRRSNTKNTQFMSPWIRQIFLQAELLFPVAMPHSVLTFQFAVLPGQLVLLSMWIRDQKGRKTRLSTSADGTLTSWVRVWTKAPRLWFGAFGLQDLPALSQPAQWRTVPATCVLENVHVLFVKDNQEKDCLSLGVTQIGQMESCHFAYKVIRIPLGFS